jgi:hypothetical protein
MEYLLMFFWSTAPLAPAAEVEIHYVNVNLSNKDVVMYSWKRTWVCISQGYWGTWWWRCCISGGFEAKWRRDIEARLQNTMMVRSWNRLIHQPVCKPCQKNDLKEGMLQNLHCCWPSSWVPWAKPLWQIVICYLSVIGTHLQTEGGKEHFN